MNVGKLYFFRWSLLWSIFTLWRRERILREQSGNQQCVRVLQNRACPTPLSSQRVCPPPTPKVGVHTRRTLRGLGGRDFERRHTALYSTFLYAGAGAMKCLDCNMGY